MQGMCNEGHVIHSKTKATKQHQTSKIGYYFLLLWLFLAFLLFFFFSFSSPSSDLILQDPTSIDPQASVVQCTRERTRSRLHARLARTVAHGLHLLRRHLPPKPSLRDCSRVLWRQRGRRTCTVSTCEGMRGQVGRRAGGS